MGSEATVVECVREMLGQGVNKRITRWPQIASSQSCSQFMWHLITSATYPAMRKQRKSSQLNILTYRRPIDRTVPHSICWLVNPASYCTAWGLEMDGVWTGHQFFS